MAAWSAWHSALYACVDWPLVCFFSSTCPCTTHFHPPLPQEPEGLDEEEAWRLMVAASGKMSVLQQLLPRLLAGGDRILLFSQSTEMLDILEGGWCFFCVSCLLFSRKGCGVVAGRGGLPAAVSQLAGGWREVGVSGGEWYILTVMAGRG